MSKTPDGSRIRIAIGLGSNVGDRLAHLRDSLRALRQCCQISRVSGVFETAPLHFVDQPPFLNACCIGTTNLLAHPLLRRLQTIERVAGRERTEIRYGPRILDLDLLVYGDQVERSPELTVPHPRIAERAFVLIPFVEIAGDWTIPGLNATVAQLSRRIDASGVRRTEDTLFEATTSQEIAS